MKRAIKRGFTLVELLTCLAVMAILAGILIVAIPRMITSSRRAKTVSNMRQIGTAMFLYANDHKGRLSSHNASSDSPAWTDMVAQYGNGSPIGFWAPIKGQVDLRCPQGATLENPYAPTSDPQGRESLRYTYVYNARWYDQSSHWPVAVPPPLNTLSAPPQVILLYNSWVRGFANNTPLVTPSTYESGRPVLFADGHLDIRADWVTGIPVADLNNGFPTN